MEPVAFGVQGTRIYGEYYAPAGSPPEGGAAKGAAGEAGNGTGGTATAKGAIVLVHGFNSNLEEFGPAPQALAEAGFHALAFDQRGFGRSEGERGRTSMPRAVEDIVAAAAWLKGMAGEAPMGILGHSLGGAYALAAAGQTTLFRCAVVAHPVNTLFGELNPFERVGYHIMGRLGENRLHRGRPAGDLPYKVHYSEIFVSHEAAQAAKRDDILLKKANLANYRDALAVDGIAWAREVHIPVLCIGSRHDRAVQPSNTQLVYQALAGPKEFFDHEGGHSCFRDLDGKRVIEATTAWFRKSLGSGK